MSTIASAGGSAGLREHVVDAVAAGAVPHHCFHVFAVYPWLGLLRTGVVDEPLRILDQCRTTPAARRRGRGRDACGCSPGRSSGTAAGCGSARPAERTARWSDDGLGFVADAAARRPRLAALGLRLRRPHAGRRARPRPATRRALRAVNASTAGQAALA